MPARVLAGLAVLAALVLGAPQTARAHDQSFSYVDLGRDHVAVGTTDPKALYVNAKRDIVGDPGERRVERWADALAERLLG